jgi:GTPase Era involved in 16S rRNA processing
MGANHLLKLYWFVLLALDWTNSKDNTITLVPIGQTQVGKSTFVNDMAGKDLAPVGTCESSITSDVQVYEFISLTKDFIVFDTPGLSDSRGIVDLTDEDIKDKIELAMLQMSQETRNRVDAFLIFESCEEKMSRINITFKALRDMFSNSYSLSSICMLTGCRGSNV